jgi:hypothetical protein
MKLKKMNMVGNPTTFQPDGRQADIPEGEKEGEGWRGRGTIEISAALPSDWIVGLQDMR